MTPCQHELSPIFKLTNAVTDQNMSTSRVMEHVAAKHGLAVLFHEMPLKGNNGSGKHSNVVSTPTRATAYTPSGTYICLLNSSDGHMNRDFDEECFD